MSIRSLRLALPLVGALTAVSLLAVTSHAEGEDTEPVATIKDVMNAMNHKKWGLFGMIRQDLKGDTIDAATWKLIAHRAGMMAEAGNVLMRLDPPRGEKADWLEQAKAYRETAKDLRKAAGLRQLDKAREAADALDQRCEKCHEAHQG